MSTWETPPLPARWSGPAGPAFVGRRREFEVLEGVWDAVRRGSRQVVFVGGEAGAGKSRLMQVAGTTLHEQGAAVLLGCTLADLSAPYEPFVDPVGTLESAVRRGDLGLPEPHETSATLERLATVTGGRQDAPGEPRGRIAVYDAVVAALGAAADQRPVVLVLEDLHWAGASTLELLAYVAERSTASRLLVLASHRSTLPDRSDRVVEAIAELYRLDGVQRLDLGALDVEDIAEYVARETSASPAGAHRLATRLRDHTGGNAFCLREVVWDLGRHPGQDAAVGLDRVPESVRDHLGRRLGTLPPAARHVLQLGAVVGDAFTVPLVAGAAGVSPVVALEHAAEGLRQGLVIPDQVAPDGFRFVHALARAAVLDSMSPAERAGGHAAVARCLEADHPAAPLRVQRLAHHYAEAHVLGHVTEAVQYLELAAEDARSRLAHLEAASHLERAARLAHDADQRDELLLRASEAFRDGGHLARAYELAQVVAQQGGPASRLRGAIAFEGASWRGGGHAPTAVDLLTRVLDAEASQVTAGADRSLILQARASLSRALVFTGAAAEARELADRCVTEARGLGEPRALAHVLETALMVLPSPGTVSTQLARARELSAIAETLGDHEHAVQGASVTTMLCYLSGDLHGLDAAREDLLRATRLTGSAFHLMEVHCYSFSRAYAAGDLAEAARHSTRLADVTGRLVASDADGTVALQQFVVRRETDRLQRVAPLISGREDPDQQWAPGLLALYVELGLEQPARRVLTWLVERLPTYAASSTWPATLAFASEAAVRLADHEAARAVLPCLLEFTGCHLALGPLSVVFGSADRHLGRLQSLLGHHSAEDLLRGAVEQERAMDASLFTGYALAALSDHLAGTVSGAAAAREARAEAVALARSLALPRLRRLLDDRDDAWPDGLTTREVEVLRLVAEGLGNRDLARRLFITENTATNHVRSILLKTRSQNRTQAALYAAAHGLVRP